MKTLTALLASLLLTGCTTTEEQANVRDWNKTYETRAKEKAENGETPGDRMLAVTHDDREMNAAIAKALKTLPQFWAAKAAPAKDEEDFFLKVGLTELGSTEFVWMGDVHDKDGKRCGTISNTVETLMHFHEGDVIEIPDAQIVDWKYRKGGRVVGAYTIRVMLKRVTKEEAEEVRRDFGWR